uniref:Reverse transcriptase domain-containing protein n=1 Tax=Tanacetum cinerariifolium TaxID=118510 RepID=A0A699GLI8_TANCI|nr:hypothetical protein [Tanacetum cinerariifolium]
MATRVLKNPNEVLGTQDQASGSSNVNKGIQTCFWESTKVNESVMNVSEENATEWNDPLIQPMKSVDTTDPKTQIMEENNYISYEENPNPKTMNKGSFAKVLNSKKPQSMSKFRTLVNKCKIMMMCFLWSRLLLPNKSFEQVLEQGPWLICNVPLILTKWTPNMVLTKDKVTKVPVWVKLHKIPVMENTKDGLSIISTKIGKPVMLDAFTTSMCSDAWGRMGYGRTLIEISARKELKKEVIMGVPDVEGKGHTNVSIQVEYEWKPPLCSECHAFGHNIKQCPKRIVEPVKANKEVNGEVKDDGFINVNRRQKKGEVADCLNSEKRTNRINNNMVDNINLVSLRNSFESLMENDKILDVNDKSDLINEALEDDEEEVEDLCMEKPPKPKTNVSKGESTPSDVNLITHKHYVRGRPWCIIGDFNVALHMDDKSIGTSTIDTEERFLMQKAKVEWLKLCDANTVYFHKVVKSQASRNCIDIVTTSNGDCVNEDQQTSGPDGYSAAFFKEAWDIISGDVIKAIKEFFVNRVLLKVHNHTIIALILKVTTPMRINDYRLISCCNVLYKCISGIISNMMKDSLSNLVNLNQSAFVPGRRISDNILLTQELMHNYHLDWSTPRCAFKVDIQKAYDTVDWKFLKEILIGFGFHPWKRGLRQGNPMSPYLFTLVMEVLTLMLHRRAHDSDFTYRRYCSKLNIINLCFADDLFLSHGDVEYARVIMNTLEEFKYASGLTPSLPKSTAYFCNVLNHVKLDILQILPFEEGKLPVKYLGVPWVPFRLLHRVCMELMEKVKRRINDWKNKLLSLAGKAQLIRSVLGSTHVYWALVFILPSTLMIELEQLM